MDTYRAQLMARLDHFIVSNRKSIMGKSHSKSDVVEEQVIIAQNASTGNQSLESSVRVYGSVTIGILALLVIITLFWVLRKCNERSKRWVQRRLDSMVATERGFAAAVPASPPHVVVTSGSSVA